MQGLGYVCRSTRSGGMIENHIYPTGLQRTVDGPVKRGDVDRAHELVVQVVVIPGNPEQVELLGELESFERRGSRDRNVWVSDGIALQLRDCLDEMVELEEGGGLHGVNVTRGADDASEKTREIAGVGYIVGNFVSPFNACELQGLRRLSVGISCGVRVRTRRIGHRSCGGG